MSLTSPTTARGDCIALPHLECDGAEGHVLVLGDNRANSWDGRYWPGGPFLPEDEIIGRAFWRFWPPTAAGFGV